MSGVESDIYIYTFTLRLIDSMHTETPKMKSYRKPHVSPRASFSHTHTSTSFSNASPNKRTQQRRYLELQSSGRKNEIRFHYSALEPNGQLTFHTETFSYRLADKTWHKVALSVSGSEIQLLIDCNPLHSRVTRFVPDRNFSASTMKLFLGESHKGQYPLKVSVEYAGSPCTYVAHC